MSISSLALHVDRSLLPWLLATTRLTSLNRVRSRSRHREDAPDGDLAAPVDHRFSPEAEIQRQALADAIEEDVAELSETDQILFSLCIATLLSLEDRVAGAIAACDTSWKAVPTVKEPSWRPIEVTNPTVCQLRDGRLAVFPNERREADEQFCRQLGIAVPSM